ncbi:unnamed protein product [Ectocarpus sp. 4 AP-2014]
MPPHMNMLLDTVRLACVFSLLVVGSDTLYARSEPGEPPEYCTVFHHMVKSAGSTVKSLLHRATRKEGLPRPAVCINGHDRTIACLEAINSSAIITGYAELIRRVYPLEVERRECEYFTMLRHPIDRLVSAFFYCPTDHDVQLRPRKWCGHEEHPVPATERLLDFAQKSWQNKAFKQMTFGLYCPRDTFCEEAEVDSPQMLDEPGILDVLQQVQDILGGYTAVGIMEHWDLSMQLFNARVRSPVREWNVFKQRNPGIMSGLRDEVLEWAHESPAIHRVLGTDMLLYSFALSIFKQQTTASLGTNWLEV